MGFLRRQQKATAYLRFIGHNGEARQCQQYTSDEIVEGVAYFRIAAGTHCTRASVTLKGAVTTRTNESPPGSLQPNWRVERVKFLSVGMENQIGSHTADGSVETPFRFDLTECLRYSTLESGLPPSLDSRDDAPGLKSFHKQDSKAIYDITYAVSASAYSSNGLLLSKTETISILPVGQPQPPSYGSLEVAGEYFTASTRSSRSRAIPLAKTVRHHVDLAGQEPSPLIMPVESGGTDSSTNIDLLVKLSSNGSKLLSNLPQQAHIQTHLVATTRVSPDGTGHCVPGGRCIRDTDSLTLSTKYGEQDCTLSLPQWETYQPDGGVAGFAITRLAFLYRQAQTERLSPTFSTPILSRSHALEIKVSFPENSGQNVKLSLPVQLVYESSGLGASASGELEQKKSAQSRMHGSMQGIT